MLLKINPVLVPVVSGYTGNVGTLSAMLVAANKKLYFKDSSERPKFRANEAHFNDFLALYTKPVENEYHINYSLPDFNSVYKKNTRST